MNERQYTPKIVAKLVDLLKQGKLEWNFTCEAKLTKTDRIMKSAVHEHQVTGQQEFLKGKVYKIPDSGFQVRFGVKKPSDLLAFKSERAYIFVVFYEPRKAREYLIPMEWWVASEKKSFKEEDLANFKI